MSQSITTSRRILTKSECAAHMKISVRTLSRLHAEGHGPKFIKVGRQLRYLEDSVNAWLESQQRQGVRT